MNKNLLLLLAISAIFSACDKRTKVDFIVHNAHIQTVDSLFTEYEAMAVHDGKILALGKYADLNATYVADSLFDAKGAFVYPGLIDAHCHLFNYGLSLQQAHLFGAESFDGVVERLLAFDKEKNPVWLRGRGWDQNLWPDKEFPTRELLDKHFPDKPVVLTRVDGHAALVNGKALELMGIDENTIVEGGMVVVENGKATGLLIDNAIDLIKYPEMKKEDKERALLDAERNCLAVGLTSLCDAGLEPDTIALIGALQQEGRMKMRVNAMVAMSDRNLRMYLERGPYKDERLTVQSFKMYSDGALGSRGACLIHPYSDRPGHYGLLLSTPAYMDSVIKVLADSPFQLCTHAIGDSANRLVLGMYAAALGSNNDRRWRIEHAQVVHEDDFHFFREYNILPSVQPTHATSDMYWAEERLGPERIHEAYAYRTLYEQLGVIPLGTDFPIEGIDPLNTFYAAVVRKDAQGWPEGGFRPEEALDRKTALKGMTWDAAYAQFEENLKGSLEVGKMADFVIFDTDLLQCAEGDILNAKVLKTFISGECVYTKQ